MRSLLLPLQHGLLAHSAGWSRARRPDGRRERATLEKGRWHPLPHFKTRKRRFVSGLDCITLTLPFLNGKCGASIDDRLQDKILHKPAMAEEDSTRRSRHVDDGKLLAWIDPEVGAEDPTPRVLARGARRCRESRVRADGKTKTKAEPRTEERVRNPCLSSRCRLIAMSMKKARGQCR
jgi:hypothetical protein